MTLYESVYASRGEVNRCKCTMRDSWVADASLRLNHRCHKHQPLDQVLRTRLDIKASSPSEDVRFSFSLCLVVCEWSFLKAFDPVY